ncbi:MAG TPA: CBS domain-containing protein [Polyangia bacterium]|nr:CBS domain-containing protein [Polyangia bacterium]
MSREVKSVATTATIGEAKSLMKVNRIRHLLVLDRGDVVGVVSDRDLGGGAVAGDDGQLGTVMTDNVVTAAPETTVRQAANLLRGRTIGCLPVVEDGKAVGIVTTTDLLDLIGRGSERPVQRVDRWTLRDRGPRKVGPTDRRRRRS